MLHVSGYRCPERFFGTFHKVTASTAVDIVNSYFSQEEIGAVVIGENTLLK